MEFKPFLDWVKDGKTDPKKAPNDGFLPGKQGHPGHTENHVHGIITIAVMEIGRNLKGRQYQSTEELMACENEVNKRAKEILNGTSLNFELLREACTNWVKTACEEKTLLDTAPLFGGETR